MTERIAVETLTLNEVSDIQLRGRWLPQYSGYATYLPASTVGAEKLQGLNYISLMKGVSHTFERLETFDYVSEAKTFYVEKANAYLTKNYLTVSEIVKALNGKLLAITKELKSAQVFWKAVLEKLRMINNFLVEQLPLDQMTDSGLWELKKNELLKLEQALTNYFDKEPFIRKFMCFFGFQRWLKARQLAVVSIVRDCYFKIQPDRLKSRNSLLETVHQIINGIDDLSKSLQDWNNWKQRNRIVNNPPM